MRLTAAARRARIDGRQQNPQQTEPEPEAAEEPRRVSIELRRCASELEAHSNVFSSQVMGHHCHLPC